MTDLHSVSPPIAKSPAPQNESGCAVLERSVIAPKVRRQTGGNRTNLASSSIKQLSKANRKGVAIKRVDSRERSGIQLYLNEIGKFPLLSRDEEVELAEKIKAGDRKAQQSFDQDFDKKQHEIEVNRKDAEVTLRELQNKVKEEQLKLAVDQATFKVEFRQFEQAKQNFQEDIEELQSKQSELKQFEDQLNRMKSNLDQQENTLPKHKTSEDRGFDHSHDDEAEQAPSQEEAPAD